MNAVTNFAKQKNTPAQIALAWLLAKKPWIVAISGTTRLSPLEENLGGAAIQFTAKEVRVLEAASSAVKVKGEVPELEPQGPRMIPLNSAQERLWAADSGCPNFPSSILKSSIIE